MARTFSGSDPFETYVQLLYDQSCPSDRKISAPNTSQTVVAEASDDEDDTFFFSLRARTGENAKAVSAG